MQLLSVLCLVVVLLVPLYCTASRLSSQLTLQGSFYVALRNGMGRKALLRLCKDGIIGPA